MIIRDYCTTGPFPHTEERVSRPTARFLFVCLCVCMCLFKKGARCLQARMEPHGPMNSNHFEMKTKHIPIHLTGAHHSVCERTGIALSLCLSLFCCCFHLIYRCSHTLVRNRRQNQLRVDTPSIPLPPLFFSLFLRFWATTAVSLATRL